MKPFKLLAGILCVLAALTVWLWPHLPVQDNAAYFNFADTRGLFGIPNAGDVFSNLPFLIVGLIGLTWFFKRKEKRAGHYYGAIISLASILTCFGSAYFHWDPNPVTLYWDRLPMTLAFCGVIALSIADRIDEKLSFRVFAALVPLGIFTIIGHDLSFITLRPYILLQFGGLLLVLLIFALRKEKCYASIHFGSAASLYIAAKFFEAFDSQTLQLLNFVSGHTIKHIFGALAILRIVTFLKE